MLIRFAGTRLAAGDDDLMPTALRRGGRTLGGALSWETPKHIAPFEDPSPFVGLAAPDEVTVSRQVLAEPEPGLAAKTWARLADGTPLVTAVRRGKGLIVLFHVTADTTWSNLPISGLFVEMLRRIVAAGRRRAGGGEPRPPRNRPRRWRPAARSTASASSARRRPTREPIPETFAGAGDAAHPPGFYGAADSLIAVNAMAPGEPRAGRLRRPRRARGGLDVAPPIDLKPWLLLAALRRLPRRRAREPLAGAPAGFARRRRRWCSRCARSRRRGRRRSRRGAIPSAPTEADQNAALETHLAYVVSGDAEVDETSRLGLETLAQDARPAHLGRDRRARSRSIPRATNSRSIR